MADEPTRRLPLLPMPEPEDVTRAKRGGGPPKVRLPSAKRQVERLGPRFDRLQGAIEGRRAELRSELAGIEPEMAVVFETAGSIDRFVRAVRRIPEMEWLGEIEDFFSPDEDFYDGRDAEKELRGSLYLVMSDRRAVEELVSLWNRYRRDPKASFPYGFGPWRKLFQQLRDVRLWGPEDRLRETGLLEDWRERLTWGTETVRAEVELWFRQDEDVRRQHVEALQKIIEDLGGRVGAQTVVPEIAYHALLAEVPNRVAEEILADRNVALVRAEEVMFLRPVGQMTVSRPGDEVADAVDEREPPTEGTGQPWVALLDGLPLERHRLLEERLLVDDPDGWAVEIPARDRSHGTAMASLVIHGDLGGNESPLESPVYVRPILKPAAVVPDGPREERIPEHELPVDLVHRAVRRLFEDADGEPPAAPSVCVLNFSVGDPWRPFAQALSPLARLLDWLAWRYKLLILVSAGNPGADRPLVLDCPREELRNLDSEKLQRRAWLSLRRDRHLRRLLSPAEGVNVLTIGGEHADLSGPFEPRHRIDPFGASDGTARVPSPVGAFGPGYNRAIKPEVFFPAGRQLYAERLGTNHEKATLVATHSPATSPGQRVASPGIRRGNQDATRFLCGTSNAAALATRAAAKLCERFPSLIADQLEEDLPERKYLAPLLKAFLVHGASWGDGPWIFEDAEGERLRRETLGQLVGFGFSEEERLLSCTDQRVTLLGWRELHDGDGHVYRIPLPPSLSGQRIRRRVTITLAWLTPCSARDRRYRRAHLWFTVKEKGQFDSVGLLQVKRQEADARAASRGAVQHEVLVGERTVSLGDQDHLVVKVSCREDAEALDDPIPYGLLVTIEVAPEYPVSIYQEIQARLRERVPIAP